MIWPRVLGLSLLVCAVCAPLAPAEPLVTYGTQPVAAGAECSGTFVSHPLPHTTVFSPQRKPIFAGVGSALGVNDLDNDGDIDIVLANLDGPSSILWNSGGLTFARQELAADNARAVNIVDFDGDGWLDLILSHPGNPPSLWLSSAASGTRTYTRAEGFGAWHVLNAIALADLDRDGDLDLVGASYDGEIAEIYDGFVIGGGVAVYENVRRQAARAGAGAVRACTGAAADRPGRRRPARHPGRQRLRAAGLRLSVDSRRVPDPERAAADAA